MSSAQTGPSFWLDPPPSPGPGLDADIEADFVVIGAGYTGLSAAIELRSRGAEVAVLERDYAGFGASGRNAGHLTPTIGKDLPTLLRLYGRERGGALVRLAERAVEHVESTLTDRGIDADYVSAGNVVAGVHPGQAKGLRRAADAGLELGAQLEWLSTDDLRDRSIPRLVSCGYLERRGGVLNPGKYVRGLRQVAIETGVRLYEDTAVESIGQGEPIVVRTSRGNVTAGGCVLATNAYTGSLGIMRSVCTPLRVPMLATEPLSPQQRAAVGWEGAEGIYTAHEILESFRLTADGRIAAGSRFVGYGYGSRILPDSDAKVFARLERMMEQRFPEMPDLEIARFWTGPIAITLDFLPVLGTSGAAGNFHHSIAYAGHGVALASLLGVLVGRLAAGEDPRIPELTARRRVPLPPEPLRWLVARGIIGALNGLDRRTDRRAAQRAR